jgi:hypothetical protein
VVSFHLTGYCAYARRFMGYLVRVRYYRKCINNFDAIDAKHLVKCLVAYL